MKCFLDLLIILKRALIFLILLLYSISFHCSFKKAFLSLLPCLWNSALTWIYLCLFPLPFASLLFSSICKASLDNQFAFLYFFIWGKVLITVSCTMLQTSVHSSSGTLSTRFNPWISSLPPLYKGFYLGHTWMS